MLTLVLREIQSTPGALNLADLSQKLGVERGALEGMLAYWVRKGRLKDDGAPAEMSAAACSGGSCGVAGGGVCPGGSNCAFVAKMPKSYSLVED